LKAYLADMKARGAQFKFNTPLFMKERGKQAMTTNLVQNMMRSVALKTGFINEENNGKAFNPLGPHALRESFGSIMINSGVTDTIVDFWLGHSIGEMAEAYKSVQFESLKRMYLEREQLLSVSSSRLDEKQLEDKVSEKVDERVDVVRRMMRRLEDENMDLKNQQRKTEDELDKIIARLEKQDSELGELKKLIREGTSQN